MKITDYQLVTSLNSDDVFIKDGVGGTRIIKFVDLKNEVMNSITATVNSMINDRLQETLETLQNIFETNLSTITLGGNI